MITKEECQEIIAKRRGFSNWNELVAKSCVSPTIIECLSEVNELYTNSIANFSEPSVNQSASKNSDGVLSGLIPCLDFTFATRLKSFVSNIQCNDQIGYEEKAYIEIMAIKLLKYQRENVSEQWEKDYLDRVSK